MLVDRRRVRRVLLVVVPRVRVLDYGGRRRGLGGGLLLLLRLLGFPDCEQLGVADLLAERGGELDGEIGRASCRERVYVLV